MVIHRANLQEYAKLLNKHNELQPQLYAQMMQLITTESLELLRGNEEFAKNDNDARCPVKLIRIVKDTHGGGATANSRISEADKLFRRHRPRRGAKKRKSQTQSTGVVSK